MEQNVLSFNEKKWWNSFVENCERYFDLIAKRTNWFYDKYKSHIFIESNKAT